MGTLTAQQLGMVEFFRESCAAAGFASPQTAQECEVFAARCLEGFKTKAELFAKLDLSTREHTACLEFIATFVGFESWHAAVSHAKRFPSLDPVLRETYRESICLAMGAWNFSAKALDELTRVAGFLQVLRAGFRDMYEDDEVAERLLSKLFFKEPFAPKEWVGYSPEAVAEIVKEMLGLTPAHCVGAVLARYPVVEGRIQPWPALDSIKVRQLSKMPLANQGSAAGFGRAWWEHCVVDVLPQVRTWSTIHIASMAFDPIGSEAEVELPPDPATTQSTRMSCRPVVEGLLKEVADMSVLEAISRPEHVSGFINPQYLGTPEELTKSLARQVGQHPEDLKRVLFKEPLGEHLLTIFRSQYFNEEPRLGRCYSAEAMLHTKNGELVAQVGLALVNLSDDCCYVDMVSVLDQSNDPDVQALAQDLVTAVEQGEVQDFDWQRVLLVRDWQVRKKDRGQGLGRKLLKEACKRAFKGLPRPFVVAARPWPLQLLSQCAGAVPGIPEIEEPKKSLERYWNSPEVRAALPSSVVSVIEARYHTLMHDARDHDMEMLFMGRCRHAAETLDEDSWGDI